MNISTTFDIEGHRIVEYKGIVRGIIVRAPTIGQKVSGGLKSIVGGKIGAFTDMCEQARQDAFDHIAKHAHQVGANAVVGFRYDSSDLGEAATEVLCYGTAVVIEPVT